ncbi:hypothetical protein [Flavobacterium sp. C4GT6]|uniref:hypothetical protein n=1 Tax=Flavobacterium sp. C4GT6 TaxID=3103818 RepID=UPI002ED326E6
MKKCLTLTIIATGMFLISCNNSKEPLKTLRPSTQKLINPGEWISETDSMAGISIRENRLAFFKDMKFTADKVYEYELIDSIYIYPKAENKVGEYLIIKKPKDTLRYQIITKSENILILKTDNKEEKFTIKN